MSKIASVMREVGDSFMPRREDLEFLLSLTDPRDTQFLFSFADDVRRRTCGDGVLLRGIVEFSNHCKNACSYCGLNRNNKVLERYRLDQAQILEAVKDVSRCGIRTVVLQSGEDELLDAQELARVIEAIKSSTPCAVTLSVGERSFEDYSVWKKAGADRYLLKIETSDKALYGALHPGMSFENRLACLRSLKDLGYQTGSGNIVGLKGQSLAQIAQDILFFKEQDFDMIGIGPFIPHSRTPLADASVGSVLLTLKTLAMTRLVCKDVHLPATTALGSLGQDHRIDALKAGANVLMPNFTPAPFRKLYEIYPGKRCVDEPAGSCASCMSMVARSVGRFIDNSVGDSLKVKGRV